MLDALGEVDMPQELRVGQEWLIENPGASRLVRVKIISVHKSAVEIAEYDDYWKYKASRAEYVARDKVRFVEKLGDV